MNLCSTVQFDLTERLFRFPCSYLVYSDGFRSLPEGVRSRVWQRMVEVLSGRDTSDEFHHLSAEDRAAVLEILTETTRLDSQTPGPESPN